MPSGVYNCEEILEDSEQVEGKSSIHDIDRIYHMGKNTAKISTEPEKARMNTW